MLSSDRLTSNHGKQFKREIYYARDENNEYKNYRCNMFLSNDCSQKYFDAYVGRWYENI